MRESIVSISKFYVIVYTMVDDSYLPLYMIESANQGNPNLNCLNVKFSLHGISDTAINVARTWSNS